MDLREYRKKTSKIVFFCVKNNEKRSWPIGKEIAFYTFSIMAGGKIHPPAFTEIRKILEARVFYD